MIEEKDGLFSVYEFKVSSQKAPKITNTFSKAYPVASYKVIHPETVEEILE